MLHASLHHNIFGVAICYLSIDSTETGHPVDTISTVSSTLIDSNAANIEWIGEKFSSLLQFAGVNEFVRM